MRFQTYFVSGGAGFIGSHLVRRLLGGSGTSRVVVFDNFSSGRRDHLSDVGSDPRLEIIEGDLKRTDEVCAAMQGVEAVFHLAANPDIAKAVTQPDIDFWEGTFLSQNILEGIRVNGVGHLFYTSGSGVYGDCAGTAFREDYGPCIPISTYGASKLACEALIASYCHMFGLQALAFRFANVVGPLQTHGVGYDFVRRLKDDPTRLRILGDGQQSKSYIHVEDVLDAIWTAAASASTPYDVFNVATDDSITVTEIAALACSITGATNVNYEYTGGDRGWKGDVPVVRFDCSSIKSRGWRCRRNSAQAIGDSLRSMWKQIQARS